MKKRDLIIYCDRGSDACSTLATRLSARRVWGAANRTRRLASVQGALVVNYGTSVPDIALTGSHSIVLNPPSAVNLSISKVKSYALFKEAGIQTVEFTTEHDVAVGWAGGGINVLSRRDGLSSGGGISFSKDEGVVRKSDFYARYFPKTHEYRVHVFRNLPRGGKLSSGPVQGDVQQEVLPYRVIDITQKKRTGISDDNRTLHQRVVRSLSNGWVHAHEGLHLPGSFRDVLSEAAIKAVSSLELDFGAVDIIAQFGTKDTTKLYGIAVLEVNTAPGLGNEVTIGAYVSAIQSIYDNTRTNRYVPMRPRFRRVRKLMPCKFKSKKGNIIVRDRYRMVRERIE